MVFDISLDKIVREAHRATLVSSDAKDYMLLIQDYFYFTQPNHTSSFSLEAEQRFEEVVSFYQKHIPVLAYTFGKQLSPPFYDRRSFSGLFGNMNLFLGISAYVASLVSSEHFTSLWFSLVSLHTPLALGSGAAWLFYRSCTNDIEQNIASDLAFFFSNASEIRPFFDNIRSELEKDLTLYLQRII